MKPIKLLLIIVAIFVMNSAYAVQYKFVAMDKSIYTRMCVLAGNNEQKALKTTLRRQKDNVRGLANSTLCNGMHIANFAKNYNANMTFDYLKKYTYKHNLDKATNITIKDNVTRTTENKSAEEIILVFVGR
ncbi:DUF3718 domain-containing protein [Candidatus Colwellia aromaticivorans]|uniref:DUF3718 domain-containing protein n=1 Tax=Candidatus Colwellia aromaticivorans TaxID=2267621 RepID=UPI000DF28651|nr:DUF3718 domain-containing protein [Candidatus Colwellia aromaticivorans]